MRHLIPSLLCAFLLCTQAQAEALPLQSIDKLDLPRYLGTWHEIARYPNRFQTQCVADSRAEYQLASDGSLTVIYRCRLANGETSEAIGQARRVGAADSARLQVRFAPAWLSFLPWVWGNYWVIDLDPDYQLVAISEPSRRYLWILARTPQVPTEHYDALLARLREKGLETTRLEVTPAAVAQR